jgi:hypothetical protein
MSVSPFLNAAGRRRLPVTLPGYLAGRAPRNKGLRYPPDPPTVEEIVAVMRQAGDGGHGARMRALIVLLWRAGLRLNEALTLTEHDLEPRAGPKCGASPRRPVCGGGSPPTSSATPTPSNSPTRASRSTSSSANWDTPISASRPSICKESTTPRSSPPSTPARRR